jgi:hypothetical protein
MKYIISFMAGIVFVVGMLFFFVNQVCKPTPLQFSTACYRSPI